MRNTTWPVFGAAALVALAALVGWMAYPASSGVQSQTPVIVGFDMDTTGNSCPGDGTDCSLGTIDYCVEVSAASEDEFDVDVFLEDLPIGDSILGVDYLINFPDTAVNVIAQTHSTDTVNLLSQAAGSMVIDLSEGVPDAVSPHGVALADLGAAEYNPPFTHGVLGRETFKVLAGAAPGVYLLTLSNVVLGRDVPPGGDLCVDYACDIWDGPQWGLIAVDVPCPPQPTPGPTPTPTPTPTVTPTPPPVPPPPNDDCDDATLIPGLPFVDLVDTRGATTAPDDPDCVGRGPTVWYSFTAPEDMRIEANTFGSNYDTTLSAYTGVCGALTQIACNDDDEGLQSRVRFDALAGETYFLMVGAFASGPGGDLVFSVDVAPPPLEIDLSIDPTGSVVASTGIVTIGGTVTCSKPAFVDLFGELKQRAGRVIIHSDFSDSLGCDGETPWSATVVGENGLYKAGRADVSVTGYAFAEGEFASAGAAATVRLRGSRPLRLCPRGGNDGFEAGVVDTNVIPCWTVVDQAGGYGSWCNQTGTTPPQGPCVGSSTSVAAPPEGLQAAMTNQLGPGSHVLYRCGALRSGLLSFELYINNEAGGFFSPRSLDYGLYPNQQFRADLVTAAGMAADPFTVAPEDVLHNIYQTLPGDPPVSGYTTVTADVSAYVGQSVCLRFAGVENLYFFHAGVDDVNIDLVERGRGRTTR